jgi:nicotinate-nucleotide--dimethylbenzimidazole phosphoribosyltransferase
MSVFGRVCLSTSFKFQVSSFKDKKVNLGTKNFSKEPAMTKEEAITSIKNGIKVFEEEFKKAPINIVGLGDMGIANTTSSSVIIACITNSKVEDVTSRGTGIDDKTLGNKINAIKKAIQIHKPNADDPIDLLSKVGGFEIGGICGCILAAAAENVPIAIDGLISTAGALLAYKFTPLVSDYIFASHKSVEIGHKIALDYIKQNPILDLNLRLGEGTGAALAIGIIEAGVKILNEMATFQSAGVSERKE